MAVPVPPSPVVAADVRPWATPFDVASAVVDVREISSYDSMPKVSSLSSAAAAATAKKNESPAIDGYHSMDIDEYRANSNDPSTSSRTKNNLFYRFGSWYSKRVDESPVLTKSATGGLSAILGDVIAQYLENNTPLRSDSTEGLHAQRILAVFLTGLCYGPILHYFYTFMEHQLPIQQCDDPCLDDNTTNKDESCDYSNSAVLDEFIPRYSCHSTMFHSYFPFSKTKYLNAFLHVAIDQGFMAFPFVALMMVITGVVEGHYDELREEFETVYIQNVHALWIAALLGMGPMQVIAFRYLSLKWRNLVANILDVIEVMVLSFITHRTREAPN